MLTKAEKIALLRSVNLFAETPDKTLSQVATLLQPMSLRTGETIFKKADQGDSMYIILDGRVRVHDGEMTLNFLGAADFFGEMALLDKQPRLASVVAVEDTNLLRLDQAPFYKLMTERPEVSKGIIRVLSWRLRDRVRDMAQDFAYMQQMACLTASAAALETGRYDPRNLDEVCKRPDELGQLARVFQRMANEVVAREQLLKREIMNLQIEIDEVKKAKQIAEITESDSFKEIQRRAQETRQRLARRTLKQD